MADWEYNAFSIKRIYYSAFRAVRGIELRKKSESLERQNRLYKVDFLLRDYMVKFKEIKEIMDDCMLPREDPNLALAKLDYNVVEINEAEYPELLRVPGIGPRTAKRIVEIREQRKIKKYEELHKIGATLEKAKPFIKVDGKWQKRLVDFV